MSNIEDFVRNHCRDWGKYPIVFTRETGMDIVIPNHPELVVTAPREYTLTIFVSSFIGICVDAIHYYAKIIAKGPHLRKGDYSVGGFVCEEFQELPKEKKDLVYGFFEVEVLRPVTRGEIEYDPRRWEGYEEGFLTNAFSSREAALAMAIKIAMIRFPGWGFLFKES